MKRLLLKKDGRAIQKWSTTLGGGCGVGVGGGDGGADGGNRLTLSLTLVAGVPVVSAVRYRLFWLLFSFPFSCFIWSLFTRLSFSFYSAAARTGLSFLSLFLDQTENTADRIEDGGAAAHATLFVFCSFSLS